jgi:L-threonylcarbamoyladenylate synthase
MESVATALLAGEVVIVPTDTVYGMAALPSDADAVHRIYRAKRRPPTLPLPVLASALDQVRELGVELSASALALAARWWPGPLTMALGFARDAPRPLWLGGRDEVAVRIPAHPFMLGLIERTGVLLVTSANQHGGATRPTAEEVANDLSSDTTLIVDGGTLQSTPSTLVNVTQSDVVIEREGAIPADAITELLARS